MTEEKKNGCLFPCAKFESYRMEEEQQGGRDFQDGKGGTQDLLQALVAAWVGSGVWYPCYGILVSG